VDAAQNIAVLNGGVTAGSAVVLLNLFTLEYKLNHEGKSVYSTSASLLKPMCHKLKGDDEG
ncbi:MAG: hypothetical protein WBG38_01605, partial [Nodosilinea sp.]